MRLVIKDSDEEVALYTAEYIKYRINEFNASAERPFVLGLPTGGTPTKTYKKLIEMYKAGEVSFKHVVTFNMDEYCGIPKNHPQSYYTYMWETFFKHIDIQVENVNILNGNAVDYEEECANYEKKILQAGGIELFMGGIGADGHIAFNEPCSSLASRTRPMLLTEDTMIANSRFFDNDVNKVPKVALTVGVGTVLAAREVLVLATGAQKAEALHHCVEKPFGHMWTASAFQSHPRAMFVCDEAATMELKVKTVKYFKETMKAQKAMWPNKKFL